MKKLDDSIKQKLWTKNFILDSSINFLVFLIYYLFVVITAVVAKKTLGASLAEAGLAAGIYIVGALVGRLIGGQQIELLGRKKTLWLGIILYLITTLMYFYMPNLFMMYIVRFLNGFSYGILSTATNTIIASCIPDKRRGEGINYYGLSTSIAAAIGPFIGMYLLEKSSFDVIVWFSVLLICLTILMAFFLDVKEITLTDREKASLKKFSLKNFLEKEVYGISFVAFWVAFCYSSVLAFLAQYSIDLGLVTAGTFFFLVYALCVTISRPPLGILFDRKGENYVMYPAFICLAISLFILAFANSSVLLLLAGAFMAFGYGSFMSNGQAICVKITPVKRVGVSISTYFIALDLGLGISPYFLGAIPPNFGYSGLYIFTGIVAIICIPMYYFLYANRKHKAIHEKLNN